MDEAERCHELVYIAYGKVLARGTAEQIIAAAGLTVWSVQGEGAAALVEPLKAAPGVLSVAAFGNAVHVAGQDEQRLAQAIQALGATAGLRWARTEANLEDVFISLIGRAQDNYDAPHR